MALHANRPLDHPAERELDRHEKEVEICFHNLERTGLNRNLIQDYAKAVGSRKQKWYRFFLDQKHRELDQYFREFDKLRQEYSSIPEGRGISGMQRVVDAMKGLIHKLEQKGDNDSSHFSQVQQYEDKLKRIEFDDCWQKFNKIATNPSSGASFSEERQRVEAMEKIVRYFEQKHVNPTELQSLKEKIEPCRTRVNEGDFKRQDREFKKCLEQLRSIRYLKSSIVSEMRKHTDKMNQLYTYFEQRHTTNDKQNERKQILEKKKETVRICELRIKKYEQSKQEFEALHQRCRDHFSHCQSTYESERPIGPDILYEMHDLFDGMEKVFIRIKDNHEKQQNHFPCHPNDLRQLEKKFKEVQLETKIWSLRAHSQRNISVEELSGWYRSFWSFVDELIDPLLSKEERLLIPEQKKSAYQQIMETILKTRRKCCYLGINKGSAGLEIMGKLLDRCPKPERGDSDYKKDLRRVRVNFGQMAALISHPISPEFVDRAFQELTKTEPNPPLSVYISKWGLIDLKNFRGKKNDWSERKAEIEIKKLQRTIDSLRKKAKEQRDNQETSSSSSSESEINERGPLQIDSASEPHIRRLEEKLRERHTEKERKRQREEVYVAELGSELQNAHDVLPSQNDEEQSRVERQSKRRRQEKPVMGDEDPHEDCRVSSLPATMPRNSYRIPEERLQRFVTLINQGILTQDPTIEDEIKEAEDRWLKEQRGRFSEQKKDVFILPHRPSETDGTTGKPHICMLPDDPGKSLVERFYDYLGTSEVYELRQTGTWGKNNCLFAAMRQYPKLIKKIVRFFGKGEQLKSKDPQFRKVNSELGRKTLRRIVCQWILDNMDRTLFEVTDTTPQVTVLDMVRSILNKRQATEDNERSYMSRLRDGTQPIDEEIACIIACCIKRPIVVVTSDENGFFKPGIGASYQSLLSKKFPNKTSVYIYNDSTSTRADECSGSHYSGLRRLPLNFRRVS